MLFMHCTSAFKGAMQYYNFFYCFMSFPHRIHTGSKISQYYTGHVKDKMPYTVESTNIKNRMNFGHYLSVVTDIDFKSYLFY